MLDLPSRGSTLAGVSGSRRQQPAAAGGARAASPSCGIIVLGASSAARYVYLCMTHSLRYLTYLNIIFNQHVPTHYARHIYVYNYYISK